MVNGRDLSVVLALACATFVAPVFAQDDDAAVVLTDYVIKPGDTCVGIAIRELGSRRVYKQIHKYNDLGPLPHRLESGKILRLPKQGPKGPDANLSARRGDVAVRKPATEWAKAIKGMDLFRRWRVNSRKRSTAEITFRDTSRLHMRENTVVIIYGPGSSRMRKQGTRATLERGSLRTRLAELDGKSSNVVVETPSSEAELGSGSALVSVDEAATARVANHSGEAARVRSRSGGKKKRSRAIALNAGMGSKVEKDKEPTPPKPLPPTPVWKAGPSGVVGWAHSGATLSGEWDPVVEAASYRIEIARDDQSKDVVAAVVANAPVTRFVAHGFPPGEYFVTVASVDADQFEGAPSQQRVIRAEVIALTPFGSDAPKAAIVVTPDQAIDPDSVPTQEPLLPGSRIALSGDLRCAFAGETMASSLVVSGEGRRELRCQAGEKQLAPLDVDVASVRIRSSANGRPDGVAQVEAEVTTQIELTIETTVPVNTERLALEPTESIEILRRENHDSGIRLTVRASASAPGVAAVRVLFGDGGPLLALQVIDVVVVVRRPPLPPPRKRWQLGAMVGGNLVDDEFELGNSPIEEGVLEGSWVIGARVGFHFTPSFLIELEGTYSEPSFNGLPDHANVLGYRAHGLIHLRDGAIRPFVLGGFGGTYIRTDSAFARDDTDKEGYWGLGASIATGKRSNLRLDVRHRVSSGRRSTFSNIFEAAVGIGWML